MTFREATKIETEEAKDCQQSLGLDVY